MCDTERAGRGDARLVAPAAPTWLSGAEPRARLAVVAEVVASDGVGLLDGRTQVVVVVVVMVLLLLL